MDNTRFFVAGPVKVLDSPKPAGLGWKPRHTFAEALRKTYEWYVANL